MVEVEQRRLGGLEQHVFPGAERRVDVERRVRDERAQALGVAFVLRRDRLEVERLRLVHALEPEILLREGDLDLLSQDLRVEHVLHADAEPHRLVRVTGADAASRRTDRELAEAPLARLVDREMPRHDQVGVAGDVDLVGRVAAPLELVELGDQHLRIDDAAVDDHARLAADNPAGGARGSCTSRRRPRSYGLRSGRPGSGRRHRSPGRAGRRSCPCLRRPTARRRSRWRARR